MTIHYFLSGADERTGRLSAERWLQAFPDGLLLFGGNEPPPVSQQGPQVVLWVPVTGSAWLDRVTALTQGSRAVRVVVLSPSPDDTEGLRALDAGACGYCHLYAVPELLREVAAVVTQGGLWLGPDLVKRLMVATRDLLARSPSAPVPVLNLSALSERELQVARAVAQGKSNKEVADQLFISERTVKAHLGHVFEKLGVRDRVQLVMHMARDPHVQQA